ncbi:N-acetylglucosamine-1-phosphodiester alpha-N-acetylglucosaminidase-like [Saccostrea echinata]|uniref:N-acetylglucosamine-1-phosphodiester alpha-N-acetylglucosaminidase-like n=1 Tax=Saccostrea echinata TaxID=191078 RepID=UPI002A8086F2|nr:N-acetylglucosamine-1-phosphodiester alpha-N-acetylglucosaminidase-like [Saccostrea echinata]
MATSLILTFLALLCYSWQETTISSRSNWCMHPDGTMSCCTSYFEEDGACYECIGSHGQNCSSPCPQNYFGPKCTSRCQCLESECDKIYGCPKDTTIPILETSTANIFDISRRNQISEVSKSAASKLVSFIKNLQLRHWFIICSICLLIVFVFLVIAGTVRHRNKGKRERKERLDTGDNGDLGTGITPHSSTNFLHVSFQSRPIDDISGQI